MKPEEEALRGVLTECEKHSLRMLEARDEILEMEAIDEYRIDRLSKPQVRVIDQFIFRLTCLQDAMGQKLFKYLLEAAREPLTETATFLDKLRVLERFGILDSAAEWEATRIIRNRLVHDYPEAATRALILASAVSIAPSLVAILRRAASFSAEKLNLSTSK